MRTRWAMEMHRARQRAARQRTRSAGLQNTLPVLVLVAFVVLKLAGIISWSWWWVLSPLWISGIVLVFGLCAAVVLVRRQSRRQMQAWVNHFQSEDWWRDRPGDRGQRLRR